MVGAHRSKPRNATLAVVGVVDEVHLTAGGQPGRALGGVGRLAAFGLAEPHAVDDEAAARLQQQVLAGAST